MPQAHRAASNTPSLSPTNSSPHLQPKVTPFYLKTSATVVLETMYGLDAPEITYKLGTRAGWYLGTNGEERIEIF